MWKKLRFMLFLGQYHEALNWRHKRYADAMVADAASALSLCASQCTCRWYRRWSFPCNLPEHKMPFTCVRIGRERSGRGPREWKKIQWVLEVEWRRACLKRQPRSQELKLCSCSSNSRFRFLIRRRGGRGTRKWKENENKVPSGTVVWIASRGNAVLLSKRVSFISLEAIILHINAFSTH